MTSCDRFPRQTRINLLNSICFLPVYIYKLQRQTVTKYSYSLILFLTFEVFILLLLPFPAVIYSNFYTFYSPYLLDYFNYKLLCRLHDATQLKLQDFRFVFQHQMKKKQKTLILMIRKIKNTEYWSDGM